MQPQLRYPQLRGLPQALSNQLKEQGIEMVLPAIADPRLLVMLQQALEEAGVPCAAPNSAILANAQHKAR